MHVDIEKICVDSEEYVKDKEPEPSPVNTSNELLQQLVASSIAQQKAISRQDEKFDNFIETFQKLLLNPSGDAGDLHKDSGAKRKEEDSQNAIDLQKLNCCRGNLWLPLLSLQMN